MPSNQAWEEAGAYTLGLILIVGMIITLGSKVGWVPTLMVVAGFGVTFLFIFLLAVVLDWWWERRDD